MKTIRFRFLVAALAVMLGAAIARSQTTESAPPPPAHEHGMGMGMDGHMLEFMAKYLDITDAQRAQMKTVLQKEHETMRPLHRQLHQLDQQLMQYVEGTYDEAKVQALVAQQAQTLVQVKVQETRIHNELFRMLTPEQQAKAKEFMANREAHMQKHMQNASQGPSDNTQQQ